MSKTISSALLLGLLYSTFSYAGSWTDGQREYQAASDSNVQAMAVLLAKSNGTLTRGNCDFAPSNATFPTGIKDGNTIVRFTCTTATNYAAYIDVTVSVGPSVDVESVKVVYTGNKSR